MLNQVILVGRITKDFEMEEKDNKKIARNVLAIPRSYKNADGVYETDFIPFSVFNTVATNSCEYCHKGDILGLKGNISSKDGKLYLNAEKVTFLANRKEKDIEEEQKDIKV